jgi:hypothetical protein
VRLANAGKIVVVGLVVLLFAPAAGGSRENAGSVAGAGVRLAQAGSTGGTLGKTEQSLSGGRAKGPAPEKRPGPSRKSKASTYPVRLASLLGKWQWTAKCASGTFNGTIELVQSADQFSGSFMNPNMGVSEKITDGRIHGNRVSFNHHTGLVIRRVELTLASVSGRFSMTGTMPTIFSGNCVLMCRKD